MKGGEGGIDKDIGVAFGKSCHIYCYYADTYIYTYVSIYHYYCLIFIFL